MGSVTSPFDPTFDKELVVFGEADVTSLELGDISNVAGTQLRVSGTGYVYGAQALVGDHRTTCGDSYARTYRVLTPAICAFSVGGARETELAVVGTEGVTLIGIAAGDCIVQAVLDGTSRSVQRSYVVR